MPALGESVLQGSRGVAALASQEVRVAVEVAWAERSFWSRGLRYSRCPMAATDETLSREAALETVRARILAAARRSLSPADAEDLTQEALLVLSEKYPHVLDPGELVALGVKTFRFKRAAFWRKAARRAAAGSVPLPSRGDAAPDPVEAAPDTGSPDPETRARDRERVRVLAEAAARLDGRCREMLRHKIAGHSFVEIAKRMGRPVNTVYSWDRRCHERLKKILGPRLGFVTGEEDR